MAESMDAETRRAETSTQCTSKVLPSQHHPTQPWCEALSPGILLPPTHSYSPAPRVGLVCPNPENPMFESSLALPA